MKTICIILSILLLGSIAYIVFVKPKEVSTYQEINNDSINAVQDSFKLVISNLQDQISIVKQQSQLEINAIIKKFNAYTKSDTRRELEKFKSEYDSITRYNMRQSSIH